MKFLVPVFFCLIFFSSCKTYYISKDSLVEQFQGIDSLKFRDVVVKGPFGETYKYKANPITVIKCVDKNNNAAELINSPSIEMRVTHNSKKTILYFDRVYVSDSVLTGVASRFISSAIRKIPLNEISRIEVQDGKKKYRYLQQ
jgi:hypothetical protein